MVACALPVCKFHTQNCFKPNSQNQFPENGMLIMPPFSLLQYKVFSYRFKPFQAIHTQTVLCTTPPMIDLNNYAYRHERSRSFFGTTDNFIRYHWILTWWKNRTMRMINIDKLGDSHSEVLLLNKMALKIWKIWNKHTNANEMTNPR
jgi:hypothetical protein